MSIPQKDLDVLVVGYAGYDLAVSPVPQNIMQVDTGTAPNKVVTVGGDGINAATSFARLGFRTALAAAIGKDLFAKTVRDHLAKNGIAQDYMAALDDIATDFTLLLVGEDGERHCLIKRECALQLTLAMIPDEALQRARHVHYASFFPMKKLDPDAHRLFARAHELGLTTSMDAVTYRGNGDPFDLLGPVLEHTDIFMPSFEDAARICGTKDLAQMKKIMSRYPLRFFGVKCGADGLFLTDFTRDVHIPPLCRGQVVDTTGAGDSCAAACAAAFLKGGDLEGCAAIASANAAFVVQSLGATTGCRPYAEVAQLAKSFGYNVP